MAAKEDMILSLLTEVRQDVKDIGTRISVLEGQEAGQIANEQMLKTSIEKIEKRLETIETRLTTLEYDRAKMRGVLVGVGLGGGALGGVIAQFLGPLFGG